MSKNKKGIFRRQVEFKPFHYPQLLPYREVIKKTPWHADEYSYEKDVQDFKTVMSEQEQEVAKRTMIAISQVEASGVKHFWGKVHDTFPRPEVAMVGYTFAENEIVHSESYSMILDLLGFNEEFEKALKTEIIGGRVGYLEKYLKSSGDNCLERDTLKLTLFSLFIENVSLFGQFLILRSFKEHKHLMQSIDNVVLATMKDELVHSQFGIELVKIVKEENPELFDEDFYNKIKSACRKAYEAEERIVDWIFEKGELDFISTKEVKEFIKRRFNDSLKDIGCEEVFKELDAELINKTDWMYRDIYAYTRNDFFNTKSVNYMRKFIKDEDVLKGVDLFKKEFGDI